MQVIFGRGAYSMLPFFCATDIARELKMHIEKVCTGAGLIAEATTDDMLTLAIYNKVQTSYNMNMQGQGVILPKQVCAG